MRVFLIILLLVLIAGCIADQEETLIEEEDIMETISISSEVFNDGGNLSAEYTCDGSDLSPDLRWTDMPDGTKSIALITDDPDCLGGTFVHWVIYNIPANSTGLPLGVARDKKLGDGSLQGKNDFGRIGYNGPCPPPGKPHRYFFKVYALDTILDLKSGATKAQLEKSMKGHILAKGEIIGKYGR